MKIFEIGQQVVVKELAELLKHPYTRMKEGYRIRECPIIDGGITTILFNDMMEQYCGKIYIISGITHDGYNLKPRYRGDDDSVVNWIFAFNWVRKPYNFKGIILPSEIKEEFDENEV